MKSILGGLARELGGPLLRRLGAIVGAYLATQGVPSELSDQVATAAIVFGGLLFDSAVILYQGSN